MPDQPRTPEREPDTWVQALSRVPEKYREDIFRSLLGAIKVYETTHDEAFLDRVMRNLQTTIQLLSSPDFVKRYEESLEESPQPSAIGVEGWVERISASAGT